MESKAKVLTFILGNGFDIAIGLKSGYMDFYKWYIEQPDKSADEKEMKSSINKYVKGEIDTWADFEIALGQYTKHFSDADRFSACFLNAKDALQRYLNEEYSKALKANEDFLKSATYRLIELSQNADRDIPEDQADCFSISADEPLIFNCISFNYTPILQDGHEDMMQNAESISNRDNWRGRYCVGEVLNVHGTLHDTPILGVDNVEQIANEEFRGNHQITELMVKGAVDRKVGRKWREKATQIIEDSDKIFVFGASIGDTDEFWWRTLARWFEDGSKQHQLAIVCHPDDDEVKMREKIKKMVGNISKHLVDKDYEYKIVVDFTAKNMKVAFVYLNANNTIGVKSEAIISAVAANSISI